MRSYLRFDITGLNGAGIQSAILKIYANSSSNKGFDVRRVEDKDWAEGKIAYKNAPKTQGVIAKSRGFEEGKWISVDITKAVEGEGLLSLALVSPDETQTNLAARESGDHSPQLVVVPGSAVVNPTPTQPAAPVPTATATQPPANPEPTQPAPSPDPTQPAPSPEPTQPSPQPTQPAPQPTATAPVAQPTAQPTAPTATAQAPQPTATVPAPQPTATVPPPQPTATQPPAPQPTATVPAPQPTATQPAPPPPSNLSVVNLTKGPELIYMGSNTWMKIFWQWNANTSFRVDWGTSAAYGSSSPDLNAYDPTNHLYAYIISDLTPGTKYFYRVVVGNQYAGGTFITAPDASASSVKFVSYGDTRSNPGTHNAVAGQVVKLFQSDPGYQTLNIFEGDLVTNGDSDSAWTSEYFAPSFTNIRTELANISDLPVIGNHEGSGGLFTRYFPMPFRGARYWSFDYGPMHVVMLDQYTGYSAGSAQYNWVKSDLAATTKKWKIVAFHEPGWSANGGHGNNTTVQNVYQPLFEQYKVAMVLAGHNHYYARAMVNGIQPHRGHRRSAPLRPAGGQPNIVKTYSGNGYAKFEINGNTLTGSFISSSGSTIDTFAVIR